MHLKTPSGLWLSVLLVVSQAACTNQAQPPAGTPTDSVGPSMPATTAPSATPTDRGVVFRDDFDGTSVDPQRWQEFRRTGVVRVGEGLLEVLNSRNQPNFPYLLAKPAVLPTAGPVFAEVAFKVPTAGSASICLDYLPPEDPEHRILTKPFLRTHAVDEDLVITVELERETLTETLPGAFDPSRFHVLRYENDGAGRGRVIWDGAEVAQFESQLRPTRLWLGSFPLMSGASRTWPHVQFDYVMAGPMETPAVATPLVPRPSASASPSPAP